MIRKLTCLVAIVVLVALCCVSAFAQASILPVPDLSVRGSGMVTFRTNTDTSANANIAQFDVNATRVGPDCFGGFKWVEGTPSATTRPNIIVSKQITAIRLLAPKRAIVEAIGFFNDRPAKVTFEAFDDAAGDTVRVTATTIVPVGSMQPVLYYDKAGIVSKGDVVVFSRPIAAQFAKGAGIIPVGTNIGQFSFSATSAAPGTNGTVLFAEFNPMVMSPVNRPVVMIQVRQIATLAVDGNTAVMTGPGILNGIPATVTVTAVDNVKPSPTATPTDIIAAADTFAITATPVATDSTLRSYSASGSLTKGDVVVGAIAPTAGP